MYRQRTRRAFLAAAGTGIGVSVLGTVAAATPTTVRLYGETTGWVGREPAAIEGRTNPTIDLEAGVEYEFVWENGDGVAHNLEILDDEGTVVQRTEVMSDQGATRSFTATATESWASYRCSIHPRDMVGDVAVGATTTATDATTTADTTTTTTVAVTDDTQTIGTATTSANAGGDGGGAIPGFGIGGTLLALGAGALARRLGSRRRS